MSKPKEDIMFIGDDPRAGYYSAQETVWPKTNRMPHTPLPWVATKSYGLTLGALNGATVAGFGLKTVANIPRRNYSDAAHIAHVANAYPRLIGALRNLGAGMPSTVKSVNEATELLRELGEL